MNKNIDILNEYIANLQVEINNIGNMYINITGNDYFEIKKILKDYLKKLCNFYFDLAERVKILNGYPITNLLKIEEISQIKSMQSREYTCVQVIEVLTNDFSYIKDYTQDLINVFSNNNDPVTSHILLEILVFIEKELWIIQKYLK
jgi:DNA-binding ferritin-like protein